MTESTCGETETEAAGAPVEIVNAAGKGPFLLVCEHASNHIPARYQGLGVDAATLSSHIAWDPGARAVAAHLAELLDAPLVAGCVSRLVYDCNRPPEAPDAVIEVSDRMAIPGNTGLSGPQRAERVAEVYEPFRRALATALDARRETQALVTVHSFTPVWMGTRRDTGLGVLHDSDSRLADAVLTHAADAFEVPVRRNDPYGPEDGVTHTLCEHALPRGLANVMLEIRNDLIAAPAAQQDWAVRLAGILRAALADLGPGARLTA